MKKLVSRKANNLRCIQAEMLKWTGKEAHAWISDMFNHALQHGMAYDWTPNWIKALYKGGDINNVNNYRTIMVGSLMEKLFGCIMKLKISEWVEINGKRA